MSIAICREREEERAEKNKREITIYRMGERDARRETEGCKETVGEWKTEKKRKGLMQEKIKDRESELRTFSLARGGNE